jgi:hypothetical protein
MGVKVGKEKRVVKCANAFFIKTGEIYLRVWYHVVTTQQMSTKNILPTFDK